ncbi:MAG TPA: glycoside hydrolase family 13 protein [Clostridiaceae bacterium]|nr:glycoside hydrolase family 13 protein [Clostridiaceae bacterium]
MIIRHNRREASCKTPYGAVPTGAAVTLRVKVIPETDQVREVKLHYAYGLYSFFKIDLRMKRMDVPPEDTEAGAFWFEHTLIMADEPNLLFYWFEVQTDARKRWLIPDADSQSGASRLTDTDPGMRRPDQSVTNAFQITVYDRKLAVSPWLKGGVMYQIFPDRFHRGSDYSEEKMDALTSIHGERIWHRNWNEDVDFRGITDEGYMALDFFGGTLRGITEKLDYLASFGVTVIYLNPIFKARSNHRYDTGDYESIDPMLGDEVEFITLCEQARARGMRIILDGVFSHTGADSRYFNRYNRYPEVGAWQEATENRSSPYSSWYRIEHRGDSYYYDSWWGFKDLPNVNEYDLDYREYITGRNGIVRKWLRLGASGWRLDVSDELPDAFIRAIRRAALTENKDSIVLGEIWEDASAKFSYGTYRDFVFGHTHDAVMNYPVQSALIGWLTYTHGAAVMMNMIETIREHNPPAVFYASMTMLSTHDTPRAITVLAGDPDPGSREAQANVRLSPEQRRAGERLMCLGYLFLIGLPGTVSVFYGDEIGLEGYRDPFCRRTFPWDKVEEETKSSPGMLTVFRTLGNLRKDLPILATGHYHVILADRDHVVFERFLDEEGRDAFDQSVPGPKRAVFILNRGDKPFQYQLHGRDYQVMPVGGLIVIADEVRFSL